MNQREIFHLAPFLPHWPLKDHPFYQWLLAHETEGSRNRLGIGEYLAELGFDITQHRLDKDQLKTLEYAQYVYQDLWMPTRTPYAIEDLFFPRDKKTRKTYRLRDGKRTVGSDKVVLSTTLVELIEKVELIYPLHPDYYFFEVINDVLFIKYQQIIGHRRLCRIADKETDHDQTH